ncbi:MAG: hypothetical protein L6461_24760 [Anaerolineae bacterium]|nr:hypothetical protein [Anaerolineae bacterium]
MSNKPIPTLPPGQDENRLREKFQDAVAAQSDLMDKLAERLITLELAIPGLYATVLKLVAGDDATIPANWAFYATFALWLLALGLTLAALTPKKWDVIPNLMRQDPARMSEGLGVEDFFEKSAVYKRRLLISSSLVFFAGIFLAFFNVG